MESRINLLAAPTSGKIAKRFAGAALVFEQSPLPRDLRELVQLRVSQINGCAACVDMHTKEAVAAGESEHRLNMVAVWREATVFTEPERAALALAEQGTRLADAFDGVSDETWATARKHFDEDELGTLICLVAFINAANRMNIIAKVPGGDYQVGMAAAFLE
ncbi:carboxymuconolactone decarboxylase family protein [Kribbella sp. NPDC051770]|uniref:carboxymuconolactone decarboxylase family protein n=1 Tax=Kribbella sp. NPDC051770 TaxID=3155413 RepID=UPI00344790B8